MSITPTTLQTIITACRLRTDFRTSQFLTDTEFTTYINQSLSQLDGILVSKFNDYKLTAVLLSVDATGNITLPSDFLKLRGVDVFYNPNSPDGYRTVSEYQFQQRNDKIYPTAGSSALLVGPFSFEFRLQGNKIHINPLQSAANYQFRIWYTPDYIPLVLPTDTLQSYMDSQSWYDYAVVDVAIKVATMQDIDASPLMMQKQELKDMLIHLYTPNRNSGEPKAVVDTRPIGGSWGGNYGNW